MDELRTVRQEAKRRRVSPARMRKAIADGELPAYTRGRRWVWVSEADVEVWLKSHRVAPRTAAEKTHVERRVAEILAAERARP